jgi:pimeloyl-ACP methyl ester carboxylesterase
MASFADRLVFPAPKSSYSRETLKRYLCWIPWNEAVSPHRVDNEIYAEGIPCLWLPATKAAGVILFCHGNAEDLGMSFAFLRHMRDQFRMNVLAVEYPGYGLFRKVPASEAVLKEAVLTAFRFVIDELKVAYEQIIIFGRSIGSGPAIYIASRYPVGGLILVAAFASIREVIKSLAGDIIAMAFEERFSNISLIGNVSCPTLFIHGERDSLVPPAQSMALFKQCRARKLLVNPPGMEHNTNLFTDASFLAVPAINFFGLPGYQQDTPPAMPEQYFSDHRPLFLARMSARRKKNKTENPRPADTSNPFFSLCGCPSSRVLAWSSCDISTGMESDQERDMVAQDLTLQPGGAPCSAAKETAAEVAVKFAGCCRRSISALGRPTRMVFCHWP